jgi:DNA invertase Pin-like site-specific DNA recombinase
MQQVQPRVLAYTRFSSPRQARGNSYERQTKKAREWCEKRGWVLDDLRLFDLGVSAYTGANRTKGALSELLTLIEKGKIAPGTYLLIEALDRLTRSALTEAVALVTDLLKAGLVIVTLTDGKEWTEAGMNADQNDFMMSVLLLARGHEESRQKAKRLRDTFDSARSKLSRQQFGSAPGWLRRENKTVPWQVIEERAESVRKVFELSALGYGSKAIAKQANAEKWPIPTRDTEYKPQIWHSTMPGRLLRMQAVTGAHEYRIMSFEAKKEAKHWRGKASGIIVPDYYPRIVSDDLWHRARASIESRMTKPRRRDEHYLNIWSGLMRCGECGAMIQRKSEYRGGSKAQLICSNKLAGITDCKTGAASKTDEPLLLDICAYAADKLGLGYDKDAALKDIDVANSKLSDNNRAMKSVVDAIADLGNLSAFMDKARQLKAERDELEAIIEQRNQDLALEPNSMLDDSYARKVLDVLYERSDAAKQLRADCHTRLSRAVEGIWHFAYDVAIVKFKNSMELLNVKLEGKTNNAAHPKQGASAMGLLQIPGIHVPLKAD